MGQGANIWDLAAKVSADTKEADRNLDGTQKKVHALADQFKTLDAKSSQSTKSVTAGVSKMSAATSQAGSAMKDDLGGAIATISPRLAGLAGAGGPIGLAAAALVASAAAAGALSKALIDLTLSTADWQGKLFDMSQQVGVSVSMLSGLEVAAATTGGNIDSMAQALVVFQGNMEEASDSTSKAAKLLTELGVSSTDTNQALREAIAGLARMGEGYKQTNAAAEAFGKRGAKAFLAIAKETGGDLDKLNDKLQRMGILLSGEAAKAADEFNDQLTILQYQLRGVGAIIGTEIMPPILHAFQDLSRLIEENQSALKLMGSAVRVLIAQPLEAWLRGNFYWLNQLGDALSYVTSRTWSIKYEIVMVGGMPIPLPNGLVGTPTQGSVAGSGIGTFGRPAESSLGRVGGSGGGRGGGGAKAIDEVAAALKRQKIEIDNAILGTDRYDQEINRLVESLKEKKKAIDGDQLALLRKNAETLRAIEAEKTYREFMQGLSEELFDATHQTDEWDKALRSLEKQLAKSKASIDDFVGAEHRDIIAKLRLIDLLKKEAQAMQDLEIVRRRYAEVLRNTRPRRVGVAENEDVYVDEAGRIIDRRPKGVTAEQDADRTRPRRALPDPWMEQYDKMRRLAESLTDLISDSLTTGFQKGMKAGLAEFALGILQMIQAKILNKLTDAITDALMKGFGNAQGAGSGSGGGLAGSVLGTIIGGIFGGIGGGGGSWGKLGGKIGFPTPVKLAQGMDFVPFDNFPALLHRGERVVPASENNGGAVIHAPITVYARNAQSFMGRDTQTQISHKMQQVMRNAAVRVT